MSFWDRLFGGRSESAQKQSRQRLDYLNEALVLERQGDYDAAVTSYRLALRERPDDLKILQNMAIALSRVGRLEEADRGRRSPRLRQRRRRQVRGSMHCRCHRCKEGIGGGRARALGNLHARRP
jgi:hypothetical protein